MVLWCGSLSCILVMPASQMGTGLCPGCSTSNPTPYYFTWEKQWKITQVQGPCIPVGDQMKLLAPAWPNPRHCSQQRRDPVYARFSFSFSLSVTITFQVNIQILTKIQFPAILAGSSRYSPFSVHLLLAQNFVTDCWLLRIPHLSSQAS